MEEVWKAIPGYEGRYVISNMGRVISLRTNKPLKPSILNSGYASVQLYSGGKDTCVSKTIHRLVAQIFIANPLEYEEVNHKNFLKRDNRVENLEWVNRSGNIQHAIAAGRRCKPEKKICGINLTTKEIVRYESLIAAEYALRGNQTGGISGAIKRGRPAYGYVWWFV